MKKVFLLLPLSAFVLTACSSSSPAPVVNATDSIPPGMMQPVLGTSATNNPGWQTDVYQTEMPSSMNAPTLSQPVYQQPIHTVQEPVSVPTPVETKTVPTKSTKPVSQDFTIPRDENNKPIYSQIDKGFYNNDTYTVRQGDTMFLIAYIAGKDVTEIAALNNMSEPYQLRVGQTIKLGNSNSQATSTISAPVAKPVEPEVTYTSAANGTAYGSDGTVIGPVKAGTGSATPKPTVTATAGTAAPTIKATTGTTSPTVTATTSTATPVNSSIKWQWPTEGRVISGYSSAEGGNKGLDIAGTKGQAVKAAAAGKVVYAGNALQGYGNLIIIKHNDDFLSAYAHNDSIKVKEQQNVKTGQTIATLGSTGTNSNKLHFEIRYHGKSVDPARYLPRR